MSRESMFHLAFWLLFAGMMVMQAYFAWRARLAGQRGPADREAVEREGLGPAVLRVVRSLLLVASLVLYAINPSWLRALSVPFPDWMRWMGFALAIVSFVIYAWSRLTLGKEWSSPLRIRERHHLVTTGPYARIRHPIYTALLSFLASITLISADWLFVAVLVLSIVDLTLRMPREEQMMIATFGEEYEAYRQRTGRLLPR
jgi:protein-S-isoprenylcysteine O-methyltransferase Ste14